MDDMRRFSTVDDMNEGLSNVRRFFEAARKIERRMIVDSAGLRWHLRYGGSISLVEEVTTSADISMNIGAGAERKWRPDNSHDEKVESFGRICSVPF
jgi:hypothetical protein